MVITKNSLILSVQFFLLFTIYFIKVYTYYTLNVLLEAS